MKNQLISILILFSFVFSVNAVCTGLVKIEELWPRDGGWVHVKAEGLSDMDISNCGVKNELGLLLNYNDSSGSVKGKEMLYSTLLTAFTTGKRMELCSLGCDSQHRAYSRLSYINKLQ